VDSLKALDPNRPIREADIRLVDSEVAKSQLGLSISQVHRFLDTMGVEEIASTSPGSKDEAALAILYRTSIHRVELGEAQNIGFDHLELVGENEPVDRPHLLIYK